MKIIFSTFIVYLFALFLQATLIFAQGGPNAPTFQTLTLEGVGSNTHFKLDWSMRPADTSSITRFNIYKANYFTTNTADFNFYTSVNRTGTDTSWNYNVSGLTVGNYSFYITSVRTSGSIDYESIHSNIKQARFKQGHVDVTFQTSAPTRGSVETLYQYNAHATAPDPAPVNYTLKIKPGNMSVNSTTGGVQWLPLEMGRYNVTLNAYLNFNPIGIVDRNGKGYEEVLGDKPLIDTSDCAVNQSWVLLIKSCVNPTYIAGSVLYDNNDTVRSGTVSVYSYNNIDSGSIYYGQIGSDGYYKAEVFEGLYKIKVEGYGIETQWFLNKSTMDSATPFYAYCGNTYVVNFIVKKINIIDTINFHNEPQTVVLTNDNYVYNSAASAVSGRQLGYELDSAPQGMVVDPYTGLVMWTPTKIGRYYVSLKAYVLIDSINAYAYKNWYIQVRSCSQDSYLKGYVRDSAGIPIKQGSVEIHSDGGIDSIGIYFGTINPDGSFLVKIDEGNCRTFVWGEGFVSQWFDNKSTYDSADAVPCACGDTTAINITVKRAPPHTLSITSVPVDSTVTGSMYTYNPTVVGNAERALRFILLDKAPGMTINDTKGAILFSPKDVGGFPVTLKAYLYTDSANSYAIQHWWLKVRSCRSLTYVSGKVKDENNNDVPTGTVKVYSDSGIDSVGVFTGTINNGSYNIQVEEGNCKIFVDCPNFENQWYDGKKSEDSATSIKVPCGSNTPANFIVQLAKNYSVSGNVSDIITGNPIQNAKVYFQSSETLDSVSSILDGSYSLTLSDKYDYIAWANVPGDSKYITQYYSHTENITESTPIVLTGDLTNIDFSLKSAPSSSNIMSGVVETELGTPLKSIVLNFLMFPKDTTIGKMFACRTFETNENGAFEFRNLAAGDYILLAIPNDNSYVPGYFKSDTVSIKTWLDATFIKIVNGEQSGPHLIILKQVLPISGFGSISGSITGDPLPVFLKNNDKPFAKEDISGAVVICVDEGKNERKYNLTNSAGVYNLDSISAGNYTVYVDKVGYGPYSYDVTIDSSNTAPTQSVGLDVEIPVGVNDNSENLTIPLLFPNPSDGSFYLYLNSNAPLPRISIYNIFGNNIKYEMAGFSGTIYKIMTGIASQGIYFVKITVNNKSFVIPLSVIK